MSQPRKVVPNTTYLITRRTILRHMLLRPDKHMTQILIYLLATTASHHGIAIHAFCAMSDHIHLVVTDVRGVLPDFLRAFHRTVALCTKTLRNWNDVVWDKQPTSAVTLETSAAVVEKIAYVLANPVSAGLVRRAHEWPGAKVLAGDLGRGALKAKRPGVYLDPHNPQWPDDVTQPLALPPCVAPDQAAAFRAQVIAELSRLEAAAHRVVKERGRSFLGAERASRVPPESRATTIEPIFARQPTFAIGRGQGDAFHRAAAALRAFRAAYRSALDRWRAGLRDAVFPAGTWWMRRFHGARTNDLALAG